MTPADFAAKMGRKAQALEKNITEAEKTSLAIAKRNAIGLSSGTESTADLARAGHPYSRRRPNSAYDPTIINAQSGLFRAGWTTDGPRAGTGGLVSRLWNRDPKSKYMLGTALMISRDMRERIRARIRPIRANLHRKAIKAAMKA